MVAEPPLATEDVYPSRTGYARIVSRIPNSYKESVVVRVDPATRLGVNIRRIDSRVTNIDRASPLFNRIGVGDKIVLLEGKLFQVEDWNRMVKERECSAGPAKIQLTIDRCSWSWSRREATTLEKILLGREVEKLTSRPVHVYTVVIHREFHPDLAPTPLGLSIKYDNRERIAVASTAPFSLSAIHMRIGDVIRAVNGQPCCSKSTVAYLIKKAFKESQQVLFSLEVSVDDDLHDAPEMPEDVVSIAAAQVALLRKSRGSGAVPPPPPPSKGKGSRVSLGAAPVVVEISTDIADISKLRSCKQSGISDRANRIL